MLENIYCNFILFCRNMSIQLNNLFIFNRLFNPKFYTEYRYHNSQEIVRNRLRTRVSQFVVSWSSLEYFKVFL